MCFTHRLGRRAAAHVSGMAAHGASALARRAAAAVVVQNELLVVRAKPDPTFMAGFKGRLELRYCVKQAPKSNPDHGAIADQGARPALWRADGLRRRFEV